jgi:hypothetical protein
MKQFFLNLSTRFHLRCWVNSSSASGRDFKRTNCKCASVVFAMNVFLYNRSPIDPRSLAFEESKRSLAYHLLANLALWAGYSQRAASVCWRCRLAMPSIFLPAGIALARVVGGAPAARVALGALSVNLVYPAQRQRITAWRLHGACAPAMGACCRPGWQHPVPPLYRPGHRPGRDVVRFILLAASATVVSSTISICGMLLLGMVQRATVPPTGWPGGWATPSASCWRRR